MNLKKSDLTALRMVKDYIDQHYKEEITIERLSTFSQLNPGKLQFGFKEMFQKPVYKYITDLRMNNAAALLVNTELSIKVIASEVGYRNTKTFNPVFKRFYNQTPTRYRREHSV
jgi:two-component system response regulator YesN